MQASWKRTMAKYRKYSIEELEFLRTGYRKMRLNVLTAAFNEKFGENRSEGSIRAALRNHRIRSGRTGQFVKGMRPWNTGTKGLTGKNRTTFRKGNVPPNRKPLWSKRVDSKDGYLLIKIPERDPYTGFPTRYKAKHKYIWEQENGPIPAGHAVIFKDGDRRNFEPENLMLVKRAELLALNNLGYKEAPAEVKPSILALSKLRIKMFKRRCDGRDRI